MKHLIHTLTNDKVLHFMYGAVLTLPVLLLTLFINIHPIPLALIASLIIGVLKEFVDFIDNKINKANNNIEFFDIIATVSGGLYVSIIVTILR